MTNEVMNVTSKVPTTHAEEADNLLAVTEDCGFEKLLKVKKGKFYVMEDEVPLGTEYLAHPSQLTLCWIKFADGKVADRRHGKAADGYVPPEREELNDNDPSTWETGLDGKPKDLWSFQHLLPLENLENSEVVIFTTSSVGGEIGVKELCRAWARRAKKGSRDLPIVKLATTDMPTRAYGAVPRPCFPITAWDEVPASNVKVDVASELSDTIPF